VPVREAVSAEAAAVVELPAAVDLMAGVEGGGPEANETIRWLRGGLPAWLAAHAAFLQPAPRT
jgi:hypothetical protein